MTKINIKKLEKSQIEIESSVEAVDFANYEEKAIERLVKDIELPGFRKGHVPIDMARKSINEMMLLEEMAGLAINEAYPKILENEKIDAIGRPEITITKVAFGNDLEFKIVTAIIPEVGLPDYKKIATEENKKDDYRKEIIITDEDVKKTIGEILKARPETENTEDFKNKVRENMKIEKEIMQKDKRRLSIIEKIISETSVEIPEILIDSETQKLLYRMEADITNMGLKFKDYLKQVGKSIDDLKKEWHGEAKKRAKLEMIIFKISETEKLKPTKEEIEKEVENITKIYKDADPLRAQVYIEQMLTNEKVFSFLETR